MKLAIASDLHLEFGDIDLVNKENAEVLILSGDIMLAHILHNRPRESYTPEELANLGKKKLRGHAFRSFLDMVSKEFPEVVYVAGNHEFYNGKWVGSIQDLRKECEYYSNIHFLERNAWTYKDITFVGGTLWTDMNRQDPLTLHAIQDMMNDFHIIRNDERGYTKLRPAHTVSRHRQTVEYIKSVIENNPNARYVVVGHHAPSHKSMHAKYAGSTLMNGGYYSDLSDFILDHPQIKLWTLGHTHEPHSYYMGDTFVVCNPRGYIGHEPKADSFKLRYVDLDNLPAKFDGVNWSRD